jgi:hypothetical protein
MAGLSNVTNIHASRAIIDDVTNIFINWTDPSEAEWAKTIIVRKIDDYPQDQNDGITIASIIERNQYSSDKFIDNVGLLKDVDYYYGIFPCDASDNYNINLENTCSLPANIAPPKDISSFELISDYSNITIKWSDPDDFDWVGTKLVRKIDSEPQNVNDGTLLVDNKVKDKYKLAGYTDNTAYIHRNYFYKLFPYDTYYNYNDSCESKSIFLKDIKPPKDVSQIVTKPSKTSISISWKDPDEPDWKGTKVIRKVDSIPQNENDGELVVNSMVKNQHVSEALVDSNLTHNVTYYYGIFPYDVYGSYNTNSSNVTSGLLYSIVPPNNVTILSIEPTKVDIRIRWKDSDEPDWKGTKVIRKVGEIPQDENDGELVVDSQVRDQYKEVALHDSDVEVHNKYFYGIFPYDNLQNYNTNTHNIFSTELLYTNVTNFSLIPITNGITVKYNDPTDNEWIRTRVVRKVGGYPQDDSDGAIIIDSTIKNQYSVEGYNDNDLNSIFYYYKVFTYSLSGTDNNAGGGMTTPIKVINFKTSDWQSELLYYNDWHVSFDDDKNSYVLDSGNYGFKGLKKIILKDIVVPNDCKAELGIQLLTSIYNQIFYNDYFTIIVDGINILTIKESYNWNDYVILLTSGTHSVTLLVKNETMSLTQVKLNTISIKYLNK